MKLTVLSGLLLLLPVLPGAAQDGTGVVRVSVRTKGTQTPIAGVELSLDPRIGVDCSYCSLPATEADLLDYLERLAAWRNSESEVSTPFNDVEQTATTDGSGTAILRGVKYGFYDLVARHSGYYATAEDTEGDPRSTKSVSIVQVNRDLDDVEVVIYLVPAATVRGRVVNMDGVPLPDISIAPGFFSDGSVRRAFFLPESAHTDEQGEFLVALPAPGTYLLRAARQSPEAVIYYPGNADLETAGVLSPREGDEFTRINIVFPEDLTPDLSLIEAAR